MARSGVILGMFVALALSCGGGGSGGGTTAVCGDDIVQAGETCDPPGVLGGGNGNICRADCTVCGDGAVQVGETCDDGNGNDGDLCRNDCTAPCMTLVNTTAAASSTVVSGQGASSSCSRVVVELLVTDVTDIFGASFTVNFDPAIASYAGLSTNGSLLGSDGATLQVLDLEINPGEISIGLTRLGVGTGIDANGTELLARISFDRLGLGAGGVLSYSNAVLLGSEVPPVEKPGIQWFGGNLNVQ